MCGIVGAVTEREVSGILLEGLKRLEYRGYDSAGLSLIHPQTRRIRTIKTVGKVDKLVNAIETSTIKGSIGIAHTRWATHGKPTISNAHPHVSNQQISLVHNGIIENHAELRDRLSQGGCKFKSKTDTEVISHLIYQARNKGRVSFVNAVRQTVRKLHGAYGLCVIDNTEPGVIIIARCGSPLVIGVGVGENFVASDVLALGQVTDRFIYLEDGDVAQVSLDRIDVWQGLNWIKRGTNIVKGHNKTVEKGTYKHFMLKEIHEQPQVIQATLDGRISEGRVLEEAFGVNAKAIFDKVKSVHIVACGTSFHAGMIAKYWLESIARIPCQTDIASDYRYRKIIVQPGTLFVTVSQSGETADTLAALQHARDLEYESRLAICNVATSSLVRESDFSLLTMAGQEIGVASTKAFTTQLCLLLVLVIALARRAGLQAPEETRLVQQLAQLPKLVEAILEIEEDIKKLSRHFTSKHHCLFLGRGIHYPVAKEGALKLKEISYIHAEAYPAGELKHGPLALVDSEMPVIAVAPNNDLLGKLRANLAEVSARGGRLYVFADESIRYESDKSCKVINLPNSPDVLNPIVFTIPLQLLSYHVAVMKGTDVDHPRNLAKSVTVE